MSIAGSTWNFGGKIVCERESVWALTDCEKRAAAAGLKPFHLSRAQVQSTTSAGAREVRRGAGTCEAPCILGEVWTAPSYRLE